MCQRHSTKCQATVQASDTLTKWLLKSVIDMQIHRSIQLNGDVCHLRVGVDVGKLIHFEDRLFLPVGPINLILHNTASILQAGQLVEEFISLAHFI